MSCISRFVTFPRNSPRVEVNFEDVSPMTLLLTRIFLEIVSCRNEFEGMHFDSNSSDSSSLEICPCRAYFNISKSARVGQISSPKYCRVGDISDRNRQNGNFDAQIS